MMEDQLKVQGINSKGFGIIPKLLTQDRSICIGAKGLYAYFCSYAGAGDTCFPTRKKICYDLNISNDTLGKYLKNLVRRGYIEVEQVKENGRFSHNVYTLCSTISPCPKISDTENTVSENSVYEKMDTNNNSTKINNSKNNITNKKRKKGSERNENSESIVIDRKTNRDTDKKIDIPIDLDVDKRLTLKGVNKKENLEDQKKTSSTFDNLIDSYTSNEQLREELKAHLKVRKLKKASLTNRAIELSLKKLDELTDNDNEKIKIVQNAIMGGWTTFYPLNPDEKRAGSLSSFATSYSIKEFQDNYI